VCHNPRGGSCTVERVGWECWAAFSGMIAAGFGLVVQKGENGNRIRCDQAQGP